MEIEVRILRRFIYVTGADGTGKSTQARLLVSRLRAEGIRPRHVWLRFPFFLSLPLLAYARWRGLSWRENQPRSRHGYWDFRRSRVLRTLLPWTLLADASFAAIPRIYLPLWFGRTIVCERFILDNLVDLEIAFAEPNLHRGIPGRLFLSLLPPDAAIVITDLDVDTIVNRRPELQDDRNLDAKLELFRGLAADLHLPVLSSQMPVETVEKCIAELVA